jgi:response regulator NasT
MKVLIAEDDPVVALGLEKRIRSLGHEPVGPVGDGHDAVAEAEATAPDVYLFDIGLPGLDGLEAATRLAEFGLRRPVVIVTGADDPALIERAISSGVGAYLTKPIESRELEAAIAVATARHEELRALEAEVQSGRQALEDRKLVERAKGLLMSALQLSEPEAFGRIQRTARERNLRLVEVARAIVEQEPVLGGSARR